MWQIDQNINYPLHPRGYVKVVLNPDKTLYPSYFTPPINWTGFVGGKEVKIIQKEQAAITIDDFDFQVFPNEYLDLRSDIVALIDACMRIMD